jgi:membrane-bound inhibitor of C-type lysozyme
MLSSRLVLAALGGCIIATPVLAAPHWNAPPARVAGPAIIAAQSGGETGFNLLVASYPGGKFEMWDNGQWREYGNNGAIFNFIETARGETTVMLHDPSRNVFIELNVAGREIRYGEGGQQFRLLYPITSMIFDKQSGSGQSGSGQSGGGLIGGGQIGSAANVQVETYTCVEGLQLTIEFEQTGDQDFATYSIDGSPPVRLPRVPSGSGEVFSNGQDTLSAKGLSAILETPTGQTRCKQN